MFLNFKNNKGFSLIEGVLATVMIAVVFVVCLSVLQSNVVANMSIERRDMATHLANEMMETILADKKFHGLSYATDTNNYPAEILEDNFSGFSRSVTITEVDENDMTTPVVGSGLFIVKVNVNWSEATEDTVILSTILADLDS